MPTTPAKAPSISLASLLALVWTLVRRVMTAMKDPNRNDSLIDKLLTEAEVLMRRRFWEHVCRTNNREDRLDATDAEIAIIWYEAFGGPMPAGYIPRQQHAQSVQRLSRRRARMTRPKHVWVALSEHLRKARAAGRAMLRAIALPASVAIRAPP